MSREVDMLTATVTVNNRQTEPLRVNQAESAEYNNLYPQLMQQQKQHVTLGNGHSISVSTYTKPPGQKKSKNHNKSFNIQNMGGTVGDLKENIRQTNGFNPDTYRLRCGKREMENHRPLSDYCGQGGRIRAMEAPNRCRGGKEPREVAEMLRQSSSSGRERSFWNAF